MNASPTLVWVLGDTAPPEYDDFNAMLESALVQWRVRQPHLVSDVQSLRLSDFLTRFAEEQDLKLLKAASAHVQLPAHYLLAFLNADTAASFKLPSYEGLLSKPLVLVVSSHRS